MSAGQQHKRVRSAAWAATAVLAAAMAIGTSSASAATIVSGPQAAALNYLMGNVTISPGESVSLLNLDLISHDVTSEGVFRPKPKPRRGRKPKRPRPQLLFRTELIGFGQTATVTGTERLKAGISYPFFCSLHPSMTGSITVH